MDSAHLRKPDTRTKSLVTQLVKFVVSQVLDVPLHIQNARTKSNRDAIADDRPLLNVYSEGAGGAIGFQMIDERRQVTAAAQLDMSASVRKVATVEAHGALRANEVVKSPALVGITARVIGARSRRPWLPPSGAGCKAGDTPAAELTKLSPSSISDGRPMLEVLRALKQSAQLEALLDWEVIVDDLKRNTIGRPRQVLHVRKGEQQARRDTLNQFEISRKQSWHSPAHLGRSSRRKTSWIDSLHSDEKRIVNRLG